MLDYRRMLMEDFSLSPEIVLHCRAEIEAHCSGLHRKGRTLHCLMRIGRGDRSTTVDSSCQSAVRIPDTAEIITPKTSKSPPKTSFKAFSALFSSCLCRTEILSQ